MHIESILFEELQTILHILEVETMLHWQAIPLCSTTIMHGKRVKALLHFWILVANKVNFLSVHYYSLSVVIEQGHSSLQRHARHGTLLTFQISLLPIFLPLLPLIFLLPRIRIIASEHLIKRTNLVVCLSVTWLLVMGPRNPEVQRHD